MITRRLQYGALLLGVGVYYISSGEWLSFILLISVLGLPWLSLLMSLPAIITFRAAPSGANTLEMGEEGSVCILGSCRSPMPPFRGRLRIRSLQTGETWRYSSDEGVPTDHCGGYRVSAEKVRIHDYLGLFTFRVRKTGELTVIVRPKALPVGDLVAPHRLETDRWLPKPGGGYSENHEHREYRPGDSLNQLHRKLSAKVGKLIVREPMVPLRGAVRLAVSLDGTPEELDRKLGRLLWAGRYLLERELDFEIRALTKEGVLDYPVTSGEALLMALDQLLCREQPDSGADRDPESDASWQYRIGGDPDEP